jgi:predicted DNA-binding protein YlxM (UPF0122 family)
LLFHDYTVSEIADALNSTVDVIYDDLTRRLPRIEKQADVLLLVEKYLPSSSISDDVKSVLQRHKLENLANQEGNKSYFDSQYFKDHEVVRNDDGTFESFPVKK